MKMTPWFGLILWASAVSAVAQESKKPDVEAKPADSAKDDTKPTSGTGKEQQQLRKAEQELQAAQRALQKAQHDSQTKVERAIRAQAEMGKAIQRRLLMQRGGVPPGYYARVVDPDSRQLLTVYGLEMVEADPVLRSQLALKGDQGLVIIRVAEKGLADQAGVKLNDVVIKLNDQPVGKVAQVKESFGKLGKGAAQVDLIREGKPRHLSMVGPEHGIPDAPTTYWIGVPVAPVDTMLRSHLPALPADSGLIVTDVIATSPAAKAGIQKNDILFKFNDKLIAKQETLVEQVQKSDGKDSKVELLRGGTLQVLTLKPEPHSAEPQAVGPLNLSLILDEEVLPSNDSAEVLKNMVTQFKNDGQINWSNRPFNLDSFTVYLQNGQDGPQISSNRSGEDFTKSGTPGVSKLDAQLEREMKALTGQIEELRKVIEEMKKALPVGKEPKTSLTIPSATTNYLTFDAGAFW